MNILHEKLVNKSCPSSDNREFQRPLISPRSSSGFVITGAHTDSPCLRLRPNSKFESNKAAGHTQLGVSTYGGGLWHTWFDRPLGLAGKVVVENVQTKKIFTRA